MPDIIFSAVLILSTVALIALVRFAAALAGKPCKRTKAELRVYFDENCECIEYSLSQLLKSRALKDFDLDVTVVDMSQTDCGREWLMQLRRKLGFDFSVETEGAYDRKRDRDG